MHLDFNFEKGVSQFKNLDYQSNSPYCNSRIHDKPNDSMILSYESIKDSSYNNILD